MQIKFFGIGNVQLLSLKGKTLDDLKWINVSALARELGVHRSTFLSKCASVGLAQAIHFYVDGQNKLSRTG